MPTDTRTRSAPTPAAASASSESCRWVVDAGMDDQGAGVADVGQVAGQLDRLDEGLAGVAPALDAEGEHRARARAADSAGPGRGRGNCQAGVGHPGHRRMAGQVLGQTRGHWPRGRPSAAAGSPVPGAGGRRSAGPGRCRSRAAARPAAGCRSRTRRSCPRSAGRRSWRTGSVIRGKRPFAQSKRPLSTTTPPIDVPWPPMNLVAECTTTSAPCSNGRQRYGVARVESTTRGTPAACAAVGQSRQVGHHARRVGDDLGVEGLGLRPGGGGESGRVVRSDEGGLDAEAPQ